MAKVVSKTSDKFEALISAAFIDGVHDNQRAVAPHYQED